MTQQLLDRTSPQGTSEERAGGGPLPPQSPGTYVLVVDDEAAVRDFLARCLEGWGYATQRAGSAAEALELMMDKPASLVLCDIRMPGQDGLWLADRLRAHWPQTPVIMATAIDDLQTIRDSRESGAIDYVTKPINAERLRQVVCRAVTVTPAEADADEEITPEVQTPPASDVHAAQGMKIDAEYTLECPLRCPACGERVTSLKAVRLIRVNVNFTSTLPRRGRVLACPHCLSVVPGELTNF